MHRLQRAGAATEPARPVDGAGSGQWAQTAGRGRRAQAGAPPSCCVWHRAVAEGSSIQLAAPRGTGDARAGAGRVARNLVCPGFGGAGAGRDQCDRVEGLAIFRLGGRPGGDRRCGRRAVAEAPHLMSCDHAPGAPRPRPPRGRRQAQPPHAGKAKVKSPHVHNQHAAGARPARRASAQHVLTCGLAA